MDEDIIEPNSEEEFFKQVLATEILADSAIFDAYNSMPAEFKLKLDFKTFYEFYRPHIERLKTVASMESQDEDDENEKAYEIPEDELCKKCKKKAKTHNDKDYCKNCISELEEEAERTAESIESELAEDANFKLLTSVEKAITYVKKKYDGKQKKNKFVYLKTLATDAYNLRTMKIS